LHVAARHGFGHYRDEALDPDRFGIDREQADLFLAIALDAYRLRHADRIIGADMKDIEVDGARRLVDDTDMDLVILAYLGHHARLDRLERTAVVAPDQEGDLDAAPEIGRGAHAGEIGGAVDPGQVAGDLRLETVSVLAGVEYRSDRQRRRTASGQQRRLARCGQEPQPFGLAGAGA